MRRMVRAAALAAALASAGPAGAAEWVLGVGIDEIRGREARVPSVAVEYRSAPLAEIAGVALGWTGGLEADSDGDLWGGAGAVATLPLGGGGWRLVGSAMAGIFREGGTGTDLGREVPVFRSQIEIDRSLGGGWRAGLALGHKSNAGTGSFNPGVETVYLTIGRAF